jgi:hypothetical protein
MVNVLMFALFVSLVQHPAMPAGMTHEEHQKQMQRDAEMKKSGEAAMGFDQDATTHHFLIDQDGGTIQVTVNDPKNKANAEAIRGHLKRIAADFSSGVFDAPFATHDEVPPGVPAMQRLKAAIGYRYEEVPAGGRVRIVTKDPEARAAVQAFLRYQIREHKTGDRGEEARDKVIVPGVR